MELHDHEDTRRMHKRARASTSTESIASTSTTRARKGHSTTATTTDTSFHPGAFASGTDTRAAASGPPTRGAYSSINNSYYSSYSFANQGTGLSLAVPAASTLSIGSGGASAITSAGPSSAAANASEAEGMQLSSGALIGIIAGGSAAGVALLAVIGWCCWKRKKAKNADAGWWSLDDDPSRGAVKNARNGSSAGAGVRGGGSQPWQSTDSFGTASNASPSMAGEKEGWTRFDEKHRQYTSSNAPSQRDLQAQRSELFGPSSNSRTITPSASNMTFQNQPEPPRPPFASQPQRPETGAYSVNDVISFSGGGNRVQYPPASSVYPASTIEYPRSTSTPPPPAPPHSTHPLPDSPSHQTFNGVAVGPQPIIASSYPPQRPPRPSEVPSAPPSPYNYVKRAEEPTARDDDIADRFMDVMTGRVGREATAEGDDEREELEDKVSGLPRQASTGSKKKRQSMKPSAQGRNKKDTIMGLTDAYAGGGEEEWAQVDLDAAGRKSTLQRGSSKRSQRTIESPTKAGFPALPTISSTMPSGSNHQSSRIDSKPLKELESYFGSFAPPSRNPRSLSGISETTMGEGDYSYGPRASTSSSIPPRPDFPRQTSFGTPGNVSTSGSQNSLSPFVAPQPGKSAAYGEYNYHPHSIYSAAGDVSEMSSGSSNGSPAKSRFGGGGGLGVSASSNSIGTLGSTTARSPLGERQADGDDDVFGPAASTHPLSTSNKTTKPSLAVNPDASYSLSSAERDILNQLGLATPSSSGERTPDLSLSSMQFEDSDGDHQSNGSYSSTTLTTPSTPHFPSLPNDSVKIIAPEPRTQASLSPLALNSSKLGGGSYLDAKQSTGLTPSSPILKENDAQYRSATLSMYQLYD